MPKLYFFEEPDHVEDAKLRLLLSIVPVIGIAMWILNIKRIEDLRASPSCSFKTEDIPKPMRRFSLLALTSVLLSIDLIVKGVAIGILTTSTAMGLYGILSVQAICCLYLLYNPKKIADW